LANSQPTGFVFQNLVTHLVERTEGDSLAVRRGVAERDVGFLEQDGLAGPGILCGEGEGGQKGDCERDGLHGDTSGMVRRARARRRTAYTLIRQRTQAE